MARIRGSIRIDWTGSIDIMNSIKTLSLAIATSFAASSAMAFEIKLDSSDVEYGFKDSKTDKELLNKGEKSKDAFDNSLEIGVSFSADYNLSYDITAKFGEQSYVTQYEQDKNELRKRGQGSSIANKLQWKDSDLGKVAYEFEFSNVNGRDTESANARNHNIEAEAYFEYFTVGAEYNNNTNITGEDDSTESFGAAAKAYPTDNIRLGYTRTYLDYAGEDAKKDFKNVADIETWWFDGMLVAGLSYTFQDETEAKHDVRRGGHIGFRPLMLTDKVLFDFGYERGDQDEVYEFTVTLATYGVASSLKSDDR